MRFIFFCLTTLVACNSDKGITVNNQAPSATFISHDSDDTVEIGVVETFRAALSDPDNLTESLIAKWYVDDVMFCDFQSPDAQGDSSCDIAIEDGMSQVEVEVRDPDNAVGFASFSLNLYETNAPEIQMLSPYEGGVYKANETISFEAVASDLETPSNQLEITWSSDVDAQFSLSGFPSPAGFYSDFGILTEGLHTISVTATDTSGKSSTESALINVLPANEAPEIVWVEIQDEFGAGLDEASDQQTLYCNHLSEDPENDPLTVVFRWYNEAGNEVTTDETQQTITLDFAAMNLAAGEALRCVTLVSDGIETVTADDAVLLTDCSPWATEIPYDGIDSNCDGLEYLNDSNKDGIPDDQSVDFDADDAANAVLGLECYGKKQTLSDGSEFYALFCDNDQYWKAAQDLCTDNGYDGLITMRSDEERQILFDMAIAHDSFTSPLGRPRSPSWAGLTRGPDCAPVSTTNSPFMSVCGQNITNYYWIDGSSTLPIESDLDAFWHSAEMLYINEPNDLTMHNQDEHCAYLHIAGGDVGLFDLYCDLVPSSTNTSHHNWSLNHTRSSACMKR